MKHFELTSETKVTTHGVTLFRIRCTIAIKEFGVNVGNLGGWVEKETNLSGDAWVYGNAQVSGDARVYGNAQVSGDAWVYGNARVSGDARVYGNAQVSGDARVYGNAQVSNVRDVCWFSIFGSCNRTTTAYKIEAGVEITCGCFKGSLSAFIEKIKDTHSTSQLAAEYLAICEVIKVRFNITC